MKKILALVLVALLALSMTAAFATQTVGTAAAGKGSITITNASKGETYKVTKVFDATVTGTSGGSIAYLGTIPSGLTGFFEYIQDEDGNNIVDPASNKPYVQLKDSVDESELFAKLTELYGDATGGTVSNGDTLVFEGLDYGYYVVSTTQGEAAITVTSTNPAAEVQDKNTKEPNITKSVNDKDVYIGETVTYTIESLTTNWLGEYPNAKQVVKYEILDTTPNFLSDVTVTSIKIDADGDTSTTNDQTALTTQQFSNKKITIEWATGNHTDGYVSKYNNGAKIIITYTAKVTGQANVGDADGNRNVVTLQPYVDEPDEDEPQPWDKTWKDDETIKTYGAAIHKVDASGNNLTDAKFAVTGLTVSAGPNAGEYMVTNFDASSTTLGTEMTVDSEGYIYILGLASDVNLSVTETEAPKGYNKLNAPVELTPIKMSETTSFTAGHVWYDADGKVVHEEVTGGSSKVVTANKEDLKDEANVLEVVNETGAELPSTGGIGTTIFYVGGGLLVLVAVIFLVTKRRMGSND